MIDVYGETILYLQIVGGGWGDMYIMQTCLFFKLVGAGGGGEAVLQLIQ